MFRSKTCYKNSSKDRRKNKEVYCFKVYMLQISDIIWRKMVKYKLDIINSSANVGKSHIGNKPVMETK